jgi:uncharacterized Fe-S cluster-containing radical SAM superfamily protein
MSARRVSLPRYPDAPSALEPASAPRGRAHTRLELSVTQACNETCSFCLTGHQLRTVDPRPAHPPIAQLVERLQDAYDRGARAVSLEGGEPTLRADLGAIVEAARAIGYPAVVVFTNARVAAQRAKAEWLAAMGLTCIQVSVQAGTAEAHDAVVESKGAFVQTLAGLENLIALGQRVNVNAVLTRHLLDTLPEFAERMIAARPREVGFDPVKPWDGAFTGRMPYGTLVPRLSPYAPALSAGLRRMRAAGIDARVTTFPPCLLPGAEELVTIDAATAYYASATELQGVKREQQRALQVKAEGCARCAYDADCPGVYDAYAALYGLDELSPRSRRQTAEPTPDARTEHAEGHAADAPETALTSALRAWFVRTDARLPWAVREVRPMAGDAHALLCEGNGRSFVVVVAGADTPQAYARTSRFAVSYLEGEVELRVVDAIVRVIRAAEQAGRVP